MHDSSSFERLYGKAITGGRFAPGERLTEPQLCELTGVSRVSVREALRQLESEGLIEIQPNRGPLVSRLTRRDAENRGAKRRFYEVLTEGSGNSMIGSALNTMYARINQLRRISLSSPRRAPQSMREIRAIVAAIKRRDAGAAYAASLHHVEQAAKAARSVTCPNERRRR